jgi:hypothetical protein
MPSSDISVERLAHLSKVHTLTQNLSLCPRTVYFNLPYDRPAFPIRPSERGEF